MKGATWGKKGGQFLFGMAPHLLKAGKVRKEGYEERRLRSLFFRIIYKLFISLTFLNQFTFPSADFNVNFRTSFPFITNKVAHL
jgi:hypothetical protein